MAKIETIHHISNMSYTRLDASNKAYTAIGVQQQGSDNLCLCEAFRRFSFCGIYRKRFIRVPMIIDSSTSGTS